MSDTERIESLVRNPPRVEMTVRQALLRATSVLFAAVATAALVLSLIGMSRIGTATACTNNALANRNGPTLKFARGLYLETKVMDPTPAQRRELQRATAKAIKHWYFQLRANPIGRC